MRFATLIAVCSVLLAISIASGQTTQETQKPTAEIARARHMSDPALGEHWQDDARKQGWSQADIDSISREKVMLGRVTFKQIFTPYAFGGTKFITSDSLLNTYHVLLEETVRRVEVANAGKLPGILHATWDHLATIDAHVHGDAALAVAAKRRAQITLGVAISLLGDDSLKLDPAIAPVVAEQVKKVREAKAVEMPAWLGKPTSDFLALDYSRFAPRGFYTQSPLLENYFRAVAWLEAIPFHFDDDDQLLSAAMVGAAARPAVDQIKALGEIYDQLLGKPDDIDLHLLCHAVPEDFDVTLPDGLPPLRKKMQDRLLNFGARGLINDEIDLPPAGGNPPMTIRILSTRRTPDELFLAHLMAHSQRSVPSGLDFAAALGSTYARQHLPKRNLPREVWPDVSAREFSIRGDLYEEYLDSLRALLQSPAKDVPALFSSPAWQAKSCQTVLAGWAQLHHMWQLQQKQSVLYFGEGIGPAGFIEPVPDFYQRLTVLCEDTQTLVQDAHLDAPDLSALDVQTHELIALVEKQQPIAKSHWVGRQISLDDEVRYEAIISAAQEVHSKKADPHAIPDSTYSGEVVPLLPDIKTLAADFDKGVLPDDPDVVKALDSKQGPAIADQWRQLHDICLTLDALANKQLRGVEFNTDDNAFINGYGAQIANLMQYLGDSDQNPRDDAMRISDVCRNPKTGQSLEIGVGRPISLHVLYPYHGGEVLCEGAVMPYYEFPRASPMTDADWKAKLDSPSPPKPLVNVP